MNKHNDAENRKRKCCRLKSGAHYWEPATPIISQCNGIFTDQSLFRCFSCKTGQFQSTWAPVGKDKTMRPHVNMSTLFRHVNISPCLWLQLVTEVPMGICIRNKFKLKIDRSVKTPWEEYAVVAGSLWWAPGLRRICQDPITRSFHLLYWPSESTLSRIFLFLDAPHTGAFAGVLIRANHKTALVLYCCMSHAYHTKVFLNNGEKWGKF